MQPITMIVHMTPKMASRYLQKNTCNRPIRRGVVDGIKASILRGEYVMSHQGIAFTDEGVLADGQHRLTAISELGSGVFPMLVTYGLPKEAFKVMDIGLKRSAADALNDDRRTVEDASFFAVACNTKKGFAPSPTMLVPYIDMVRDYHDDLMAYCSTSSRTWSAVGIRSAAVLTMMRGGDAEYIKSVYRALVLTDFDSMPPVARALVKQQLSGLVNIRDKFDTVARCLAVFDQKKAKNTKIQVKSKQEMYRIVRETFFSLT